MIAEAVSEFRGEPVSSPAELKLEIPVDARIPPEYLDSERLRLEAYHKLSAASSGKSNRKDLDAILAELEDRFGKAPEPVMQLLQVTELRQQANRLGLKDVNLLGAQAKLSPVDLSDAKMVALSHKLPRLRYLQSSKLLTVPMPISEGIAPITSTEVIDWLWQLFAIVFEESLGKAAEPN